MAGLHSTTEPQARGTVGQIRRSVQAKRLERRLPLSPADPPHCEARPDSDGTLCAPHNFLKARHGSRSESSKPTGRANRCRHIRKLISPVALAAAGEHPFDVEAESGRGMSWRGSATAIKRT